MKNKITGKFENVQQLEDAYKNLQAEFTKRCQLTAQLEKQLQEGKDKRTDKEQIITLLSDPDFIDEYILGNEEIVNAVVVSYLKSLKGRNRVNLLGSKGTIALYVDKKPTSLSEAKALAQAMIMRS